MAGRCHACGAVDCPAAGEPYVDDCALWQEAEARRARGEFLPTTPPSRADSGTDRKD